MLQQLIRDADMTKKVENYSIKHMFIPTLSLFTSISTLICCALPALFVALGAGAALAGLVSNAPWLVALSKYKAWTFGFSGVIILFAGFMRWKTSSYPCPIDSTQAKACMHLRKISAVIYWVAVTVWCIGFFFAFIAVHIFF